MRLSGAIFKSSLLLFAAFANDAKADQRVSEPRSCFAMAKTKACFTAAYHRLRKGLHRSSVEKLLGEADYSPTSGQYRYSIKDSTLSLVVDYRDGSGIVTDNIQQFWIVR